MSKSFPAPPHIIAAQEQVAATLARVEGKPVDLLKTPWQEIEAGVIKLLGGPFRLDRPEHQMIALGLAGAFAQRVAEEQSAFWFPNRDSLEGAALGFADALIMISPFGAIADALQNAKLQRLDQMAADLRRSIAEVKFTAGPNQLGQTRLRPEDYQRLFDPGFLQFVLLDAQKAKQAWESRPDALQRDIRDALGRTQPPLPPEARQQFEGQIVMSLQRMDPAKPLSEQVEKSPRAAELMGHLFATSHMTGAAPEEIWQELVMPLLFIGTPDQFPPLDDEELEAFKQGADPIALFVDVVPYQRKAPEEGLLGAFELSDVGLPHPAFQRVASLRLIKLDRTKVHALVKDFDAAKTRAVIARFTEYLEEKSGQKSKASPAGNQMLDAAVTLLTDLNGALASNAGELCLRRITEAEAASEPALSLVRNALQGPRIILT